MQATFSLSQLVLLIGATYGVLLIIGSFFWRPEDRVANRLFAGILLILTLMMLGSVRSFGGGRPEEAPYIVLHSSGALALLLGPLVYGHVRTSVDRAYLFTAKRLVHLLPALAHMSLLLPLLIAGTELRATYIESYLERELYRSAIPGIRIGFVSLSLYVIASFVWIRRFEKHVGQVASFADERRVRWLRWFTGLLLVLVFFLGLFVMQEVYQLLASVSLAGFMAALLVLALVRPEVFHGIPNVLKLSEETADADEKYSASQLDEEQKTEVLATLQRHFEQERPYLRHELTLREVSSEIDVPYRYVSQVVNEKLEQNFMDFVNGYRVVAAQAMLLDAGLEHLTVDGIAGEAGFKSRSAFYTAFKKVTGTTPGAFRKHVSDG
ncbi:MAG: helix-turn-helix domain-containing protein [Bacteroidota bacterium]